MKHGKGVKENSKISIKHSYVNSIIPGNLKVLSMIEEKTLVVVDL